MNRFLIALFEFLGVALIAIAMFLAVLIGLTYFHPAIASTPIDRCDEQGGIWQTYPTPHCADKPMTDEQIQSAQRYTILKQIETRLIYAEN